MDGTSAAGGSEEGLRSRGQLVAAAIASLQLLPCWNIALLLTPLAAPLGHAGCPHTATSMKRVKLRSFVGSQRGLVQWVSGTAEREMT
jgi:hypothetical protein